MGLDKRWSWAHCARDESGQLRGVIDLSRRTLDGSLIASGEGTDRGRQEERARIVRVGEKNGNVGVAAGVLDGAIGVVGVLLFLRRVGVFTVAAGVGVDVLHLSTTHQEDRDGPDEMEMTAKDEHEERSSPRRLNLQAGSWWGLGLPVGGGGAYYVAVP